MTSETSVVIPWDAAEIVKSFISKTPQHQWREGDWRMDGCRFKSGVYAFTVISSLAIEKDGKRWLHVSFSHQKRVPNYDEIKMVKHDFIGDDKKAIMVFPEADKYVNIMPYCLHLWHCLDDCGLPEFSGVTAEGMRSL